MGDRRKLVAIVVAGLMLLSVGFFHESFAATYVYTYTIPYYQLNDFLTNNGQYVQDDEIEQIDISSFSSALKKIVNEDTKNSKDKSFTRPTFGVSHQDSSGIVRDGFKFNDKAFSVNDNFHTPFAKQPIKLGEVNTFEAKVFAMEKIRVQEFIFGIPSKGEAHLGEMAIEVHYDMFGEIQKVTLAQNTNVVDPETITVTHEKAKCLGYEGEKKCDATKVSVVFLEPLKDSVMAIKAIDYKNRYQITYLNDGFDISGTSLNPMAVIMIPSPVKYEGLIPVTQTEKYSSYWATEDGKMFEKNKFDSFKQINKKFERFQDSGEPRTRLHSGFGGVMAYENMRATELFDSTKLVSELPQYFAFSFDDSAVRVDKTMKQKMKVEEEKAMEIIANMPEFQTDPFD